MKKLLLFFITTLIISCMPTEENVYQKSELQNLTLTDLRIKRNEIFAKHGYIFKSEDLTDYFSKFEWYNPTLQNVDSLLSEHDKTNIDLIVQLEREIKNSVIYTAPNTIDNYRKLEDTSNKAFIAKLIKTISQFKDKKADTTVLQICNIDNLGALDTLKNHIYYSNNSVIVNSSWTRDGKKLWEEEIINPHLWIDESEAFLFETRKPWVTFTTGIYYAIPEIENIDYYAHIDKQMVMQIGMDWAKRAQIKLSEKEYSSYLDHFKGDIIFHGDPEIRYELLIWYEPAKTFIVFYAP